MTYRSDSSAYYRGSSDNSAAQHPQYSNDSHQNSYENTSTSYYDRTHNYDNSYRRDLSTQGALDAWAPRRSVRENDYRDPDSFKNPYDDLGRAEQLMHTQGFNAARRAYLRSIDDADGINLNSIKEDRHFDMQHLRNLNDRESRLAQSGTSLDQLQNLENQRQQILNNERELNSLYYAPANTRISMGLACIKTGDPMEIMEGQRLIAEAKQKRPEIADDPRLQKMIDNAFQIGYRNHRPEARTHAPYQYESPASQYEPQSNSTYNPTNRMTAPANRMDAPANQADAPANGVNAYPTNRVEAPANRADVPANRADAPANRMDPSTRTDAPMPTPQPRAEQPKLEPLNATPSNAVQPRPWESGYTPTILPPASPRTEITAPPGLPNDTSRPTRELEDNSQKRVSDSEALNWLHGKYQHLTIEQKQQNDRDAQKAYDNTPSSWNPFASLSWEDRASAAKQQKMLEFSQGFRTDLNNLLETSNQPHSFDSDMARQSLITIIKRSAENMSDEAGNREISEECCAQVKELCKANANGRKEMVDAVRIGLTESSHLPSGAKNYLMDGLVLLATDKPPVITADAAGRLTLLALKHEIDNTPRLGAPDQRGETRDEVTRRQVRLIQMLDQFGYKNALGDLQDIVKSNADDQIREAAAKAIQNLRRAA